MKQTNASATKNGSSATRNTLLIKSQERGGHKKQQKSLGSSIQHPQLIKTNRTSTIIEISNQVDYTISINLDSPESNSQENKDTNDQFERVISPKPDKQQALPLVVNGSPIIDANKTLLRWQKQDWTLKQIDQYLAVKHVLFKKYKYNIYMMQKAVLKIQHYYFKKLAAKQRNQHQAVSVTRQINLNSSNPQASKSKQTTTAEISINIQAVKKQPNQHQLQLQQQPQLQQQLSPTPQVQQVIQLEQKEQQQQQQQQLTEIKQKKLKQQIVNQDESYHLKVVQQGSPLKHFYSPRPGEVNTRDKDSAVLSVLKKVMDDRSQQNHSRFSARFQKSKDKYNHLQSFEEKSFIKLRPSAQAIEALTESKATEIFNSYNREREYMSRKKSNSPLFNDRLTILTENGANNNNNNINDLSTPTKLNQIKQIEISNNENLKNNSRSKDGRKSIDNDKINKDQIKKQIVPFESTIVENDNKWSPNVKNNINSGKISNCSSKSKKETSTIKPQFKSINSPIKKRDNNSPIKKYETLVDQQYYYDQISQTLPSKEQSTKIQNQSFEQSPQNSRNQQSSQKISDIIKKRNQGNTMLPSDQSSALNKSVLNQSNNQQFHIPIDIKDNVNINQGQQNAILSKSKSQPASKFNPVRSQRVQSQPTVLQSYMMKKMNGSNSSSSLMEPLLSTKNEKKFSNSRLNDTTCASIKAEQYKNNNTTTVQQQSTQLFQNNSSKDLNYSFEKCQIMDRKSLTAQKQAPLKVLEQIQSPIVIPDQNSLQSSSRKKALVQYTPVKEKEKSNIEMLKPRESPPQAIKQQQQPDVQSKFGYSSKLQKDKQYQKKQSQDKQQIKGTAPSEQKVKVMQQPSNQIMPNNQQIVNQNLSSGLQKIDKQALLLDILEKGRLLEQKESQLKSQMSQRSRVDVGEYKILKLQNPKSKLNSVRELPSKQKIYQQMQLPTNNSYQVINPIISEQRQILTSDRSSLPIYENKTPITQISQRSPIVDKRNSQQHNLAMTQQPFTLKSMAEQTDKLLVSSFDSSQNKSIGKAFQNGTASKNFTNDKGRYLKSLKKQYGLQRKKSTDSIFSRTTIENTLQHTAVIGAQFDTKSVHSRGFSQALVFEKLSNDYQSRISGIFNYNNGMSSSLHRSTESVNQKRRDKHTFDHDERDVRMQATTASRITQIGQKNGLLSERKTAI